MTVGGRGTAWPHLWQPALPPHSPGAASLGRAFPHSEPPGPRGLPPRLAGGTECPDTCASPIVTSQTPAASCPIWDWVRRSQWLFQPPGTVPSTDSSPTGGLTHRIPKTTSQPLARVVVGGGAAQGHARGRGRAEFGASHRARPKSV